MPSCRTRTASRRAGIPRSTRRRWKRCARLVLRSRQGSRLRRPSPRRRHRESRRPSRRRTLPRCRTLNSRCRSQPIKNRPSISGRSTQPLARRLHRPPARRRPAVPADRLVGGGGDCGSGRGGSARATGQLEVLSDTQGVDFGPYLSRVLQAVKMNWYNIIPEAARAPLLERGKVSIEFAILPDGRVAGLKYISPSGDVALDRAAWGGITASNPFATLPGEFPGPYLALRFHFYYNPAKGDMQ